MESLNYSIAGVPVGLRLSDQFDTHQAVSAWREQVFIDSLLDGTSLPWVFPFALGGWFLLLAYFLVPGLHTRSARLATFAVIASFDSLIIMRCKSLHPSAGFAIGILAAWNATWSAVLLVFRNAVRDFKRVRRECNWRGRSTKRTKSSEALASPSPFARRLSSASSISSSSSSSSGEESTRSSIGGGSKRSRKHRPDAGKILIVTYTWQEYPLDGSFKERLEWAADLVFNFRGIGWDWKISGMPSRPRNVEASLRHVTEKELTEADKPVSSSGRIRFESLRSLVLHHLWLIIKGWIILDVLKTIGNHDPYFWGIIDSPPPQHLPLLVQASPVLTKIYRTTVAMAFLWATLRTVFSMATLFCVALLSRGVYGSNGEAWMYPDQYGSFMTVLDRGMAGWWGGWWHQVFRFGFQSGAKWLVTDVLRVHPKSPLSMLLQLCVSFYISGIFHVASSITMVGDTNPWSGPMLFFALQPLGIIIGLAWSALLKQAGLRRRIPTWLGRFGNFAYVHYWLYLTAPLLTDDLSRGGLYLQEPLPYSPLRGLGFGAPGDTFYTWSGSKPGWETNNKWWLSGYRI